MLPQALIVATTRTFVPPDELDEFDGDDVEHPAVTTSAAAATAPNTHFLS
jgi:hypothetical protein